ncbi:sorting nexin-10-like [Uloborus diversus]|uniref:sorting nexin-10-like n=1 Tax=Uloborus diversus TaxID=327109 RepID=UPI00240916F2|nr:sorting nexin-10-like [Uloborus diversus]
MMSMESDITDGICDHQELFEDVKVQKPKYEAQFYVSYEIVIETESLCFSLKRSSVRRRYSEFLALQKILIKEFPALKCPPMPSKFPFKNHLDPNFVEKRREDLEVFLKKLLAKKVYLSSKALHLFLQTNVTISEIKEIITGKKVREIVKDVDDIQSNRTITDRLRDMASTSSVSSFDDNAEGAGVDGKTVQRDTEAANENCDQISVDFSNSCNVDSPRTKRVSFCEQVTVAQIHVE